MSFKSLLTNNQEKISNFEKKMLKILSVFIFICVYLILYKCFKKVNKRPLIRYK